MIISDAALNQTMHSCFGGVQALPLRSGVPWCHKSRGDDKKREKSSPVGIEPVGAQAHCNSKPPTLSIHLVMWDTILYIFASVSSFLE